MSIACAAIAGSIRAGCRTDSGTYRPRRCDGPAACAVTHTDRASGPGAAAPRPPWPRSAAEVALVGSSGSAAASRVVRLATDTTTSEEPAAVWRGVNTSRSACTDRCATATSPAVSAASSARGGVVGEPVAFVGVDVGVHGDDVLQVPQARVGGGVDQGPVVLRGRRHRGAGLAARRRGPGSRPGAAARPRRAAATAAGSGAGPAVGCSGQHATSRLVAPRTSAGTRSGAGVRGRELVGQVVAEPRGDRRRLRLRPAPPPVRARGVRLAAVPGSGGVGGPMTNAEASVNQPG